MATGWRSWFQRWVGFAGLGGGGMQGQGFADHVAGYLPGIQAAVAFRPGIQTAVVYSAGVQDLAGYQPGIQVVSGYLPGIQDGIVV